MNDEVNKPAHYTSHPSGIECIEVTRHFNFNIGNAVKYCWRAGLKLYPNKDSVLSLITDLEKAVWYIQDEIKRLKGELEDHEKQYTLKIEDSDFFCQYCNTVEPKFCNCQHKAS